MIKFRGKDKNKQWIYGYCCKVDGKHYIIPDDSKILRRTISDFGTVFGDVIAGIVEVDPETVGQYTGLKDKNGKEIYFDSDIVEYSYTSDCGTGFEEEFTVTGVVVLDLKHTNSLCVLEKRNGRTGGSYHFTAGEVRNIKVIGNATDNPELLGVNK